MSVTPVGVPALDKGLRTHTRRSPRQRGPADGVATEATTFDPRVESARCPVNMDVGVLTPFIPPQRFTLRGATASSACEALRDRASCSTASSGAASASVDGSAEGSSSSGDSSQSSGSCTCAAGGGATASKIPARRLSTAWKGTVGGLAAVQHPPRRRRLSVSPRWNWEPQCMYVAG